MIPKIIHYCWLSGEPYPEKIQECINSWKEKLPDYQIMLWDKQRFNIDKIPWTQQAYDKGKYAYAADYIRFYALYNYGGIYLDSDVEVTKKFDDLLEQEYFFGYEYTGSPEAAVIGAKKGMDWVKKCMEWYEKRNYNDYAEFKKNIIAPLILQKGFEDTYHCKLIDNNQMHKCYGGTIFPFAYFSPKNGFTGEIAVSGETYTIHHFNSAWLSMDAVSLKRRRGIHIFIIKLFGKVNYNRIMYYVRKILHKAS